MFWHVKAQGTLPRIQCALLSLSLAMCFPFLLSAVYSVRCIIDIFFPFSLLLLDISCLSSSHWPHRLWSLESGSEFDPTWSIFYCLVFNTF